MKKRTKSQLGKSNRRSGHQYERDTAKWYRKQGFTESRRGQQYDGKNAPDVMVMQFVDCAESIHVECKKTKVSNLAISAYKQAKEKAGDCEPVVHLHQTRGDHLVVISRRLWGEVLAQGLPWIPF